MKKENTTPNEHQQEVNTHAVMPRFDSPKNWTEDYKHENGNYTCRCCRCKEYFFGHKRRVLCVECANQLVDDAL